MSPPPPPSASYNWKFDSSDEEEDEEEKKLSEDDDAKCKPTRKTEERNNNDNEETIPETLPDSPNSKKKKKRHKRKSNNKKSKSKKNNNNNQPPKTKQLRFGTVRTRTFERCLGSDVVPGDGGWPLGMGRTLHEWKMETTVDEYEASKNERLLQRLERLKLPQTIPLETRPWDYKPDKNPLFQLLTEKDRIQLLVGTDETTESSNKHKSPERKLRRSSRNVSSSSSNDSILYNDRFPKTDVLHYRHELEQLRISRSSTGCRCRKLHVYIAPPNAGKKAQHRRLKLPKLQHELKKRHALPNEPCGRDALERLLLELVEHEPCCGDSCECKQAGINCQAESCSCWYDSHQNSNKKKEPSNAEIQARCGNAMYVVDLDSIQAFRQNYLEQLRVCPVISP